MKPQINKRVFIRALWSSISRMVGVCLGAIAGTLVGRSIGDKITNTWGIAFALLVVGMILMLIAEYEKSMHN